MAIWDSIGFCASCSRRVERTCSLSLATDYTVRNNIDLQEERVLIFQDILWGNLTG